VAAVTFEAETPERPPAFRSCPPTLLQLRLPGGDPAPVDIEQFGMLGRHLLTLDQGQRQLRRCQAGTPRTGLSDPPEPHLDQ
jgi:hypothetical protein